MSATVHARAAKFLSPGSLGAVVLASALMTGASGCRSTNGSFSMDSNSRLPWFGLNFALPKPSARRKTLETISDAAPHQPVTATADLKTSQPELEPVRSLLPKWLGGSASSLPLPAGAPRIDEERMVRLEGPREEFH